MSDSQLTEDKIGFRIDDLKRQSYTFLTMIVGISTQIKRFYDLNKAEPFSNGKEIFILASMGTH
jgi:hypothetical protein